jgi:hypothetical protein
MWTADKISNDDHSVTGRAIHHEEVKGLFGVNPSYFLSTPAGRIINRFSQVS